jgi:hypothetical protein
MRAAPIVSLILGLVACTAPAPETPATPATPPVVAEVKPGPAALADIPPGPEGRSMRRKAVLELLVGGGVAASLPLVDTAPGREFDPQLADKLTPKEYLRRYRVPTVRQAKATVEGPLDKDPIRKVVREHINEIRRCYDEGLALDFNLKGRVEVKFKILGDGTVGESAVLESTLRDADVATCIGAAPLLWTFPKPERGETVTVGYPFVLEPG